MKIKEGWMEKVWGHNYHLMSTPSRRTGLAH